MSIINNKVLNGIKTIVSESSSFEIDDQYNGKIISADPGAGTITVTLPSGMPAGFSFEVMQISPGIVEFSSGAGATIYNGTTTIGSEYQRVRVISGIFISNEWLLAGNLV